MTDALIGHTGFVGSNLARQRPFDEFYNSKNIEDIRGRSFDTVICAGAPGSKWYANAHPEEDLASIEKLVSAGVHDISAERFVLVSTVDVFSVPRGVNEDSQMPRDDDEEWSSYGRHRLMLEDWVTEHLGDRSTIIRLPALFGPGLKKNALYDLMTGHETAKIAPNAVYQWYPVGWLWRDIIERAVMRRLPLVHCGSPGMSMAFLREWFFPCDEIGFALTDPPRYDVRSKYEEFWYSKSAILSLMEAFIAQGIQQPR